MLESHDKFNCCGCTACANACAHHAIRMVPDNLGFLYPEVNKDACVDCGLCNKICQFHLGYKRYNNFKVPISYQLRLNDVSLLGRSQSGGAFFVIAQQFIISGGVVYGAAFTDTWKVSHQRILCLADLEKLRMSKYVQSDMRGVYVLVKNDLKQGLKVLFSGTSCQVAGLKSYLPNALQANLYCIDIICHGVPSPRIWDDYINYLQTTRNSSLVKVCFRDKRFGWHGATESFLFANGFEEFRKTSNHLYFSGLSMRECCSVCPFANIERIGDITLGDHWGISKSSPLNDEKGLSLVLINSEKGNRVMQSINRNDCMITEISIIESMQQQLQSPSQLSPLHDKFVLDYLNNGFLYVARKYSDMGWRYKVKQLKKLIKRIIFVSRK